MDDKSSHLRRIYLGMGCVLDSWSSNAGCESSMTKTLGLTDMSKSPFPFRSLEELSGDLREKANKLSDQAVILSIEDPSSEFPEHVTTGKALTYAILSLGFRIQQVIDIAEKEDEQ